MNLQTHTHLFHALCTRWLRAYRLQVSTRVKDGLKLGLVVAACGVGHAVVVLLRGPGMHGSHATAGRRYPRSFGLKLTVES